MSPDKQIIAIAEELGMKWVCVTRLSGVDRWWAVKKGDDSKTECVPNYLNDLNACHEMEKSLRRDHKHEVHLSEHDRFCCILSDITRERNPVSAKAYQRCEAFLKVKGKWTNEDS